MQQKDLKFKLLDKYPLLRYLFRNKSGHSQSTQDVADHLIAAGISTRQLQMIVVD